MIPLFLCVLFLKEPKSVREETHVQETHSQIIPKKLYVFVGFQFAATMTLYPLLSGMSSYLSWIGIQDPAVAGTMLSVYIGGGVCGNMMLPFLHKKLHKYTLIYAYGLVIVGLFLILFVPSLPAVAVGVFVAGMGFISSSATYQVFSGLMCRKDQVAAASTMVMAANQLGVFLSNFYISATSRIQIFQEPIANSLLVCLFVYLMMALVMFGMKKKLLPDIGT